MIYVASDIHGCYGKYINMILRIFLIYIPRLLWGVFFMSPLNYDTPKYIYPSCHTLYNISYKNLTNYKQLNCNILPILQN